MGSESRPADGSGVSLPNVAMFSRRSGVDLDVVYCLSNEAMPGRFKIGFTTRTAGARAADLYDGYGDAYTTGVPMPFEVVREWELPSGRGRQVEQAVHRVLGDRRPNPKREFFHFDDASHAVAEIERALHELDWYATAVAEVENKQREAQLRVVRRQEAEAAERAAEQRTRETVTRIEREMRMEAESSTSADGNMHGLKWAGGIAAVLFGLGAASDARDSFLVLVGLAAAGAYYWNRSTPLDRLLSSRAYRERVGEAVQRALAGDDAEATPQSGDIRPDPTIDQQAPSPQDEGSAGASQAVQADRHPAASRSAVTARCPSCECLHGVGVSSGAFVRVHCVRCRGVFETEAKVSREAPRYTATQVYLVGYRPPPAKGDRLSSTEATSCHGPSIQEPAHILDSLPTVAPTRRQVDQASRPPQLTARSRAFPLRTTGSAGSMVVAQCPDCSRLEQVEAKPGKWLDVVCEGCGRAFYGVAEVVKLDQSSGS